MGSRNTDLQLKFFLFNVTVRLSFRVGTSFSLLGKERYRAKRDSFPFTCECRHVRACVCLCMCVVHMHACMNVCMFACSRGCSRILVAVYDRVC